MKELNACEMYAVRRVSSSEWTGWSNEQKLGMWEERTSTFDDNMFVKGWYALYRPFYTKYVHRRCQLNTPKENESF